MDGVWPGVAGSSLASSKTRNNRSAFQRDSAYSSATSEWTVNRRLAIEAAEEKLSINQLIIRRLNNAS